MVDAVKPVSKNYGWIVLAVTFLAGFTAPANMAKVTALAPVVARVFNFELDIISWVIAMFFILGFVLAFPAAAIIKKLGIRKVVSIAVICGAAGSLLGAVTTNFPVFMVSRVFEGAGMGIMGVAGASAIAPWFPKEKRGFPLGIWAMWVALAMFACPVLYGWISESFGVFNPFEASIQALTSTVSTVWWGNFVFDIFILIIFNIFYRDAPKDTVPEEFADEKLRITDVFKNKLLWALGLIFLFDELSFMAVNGLFTTYLTGGSPTVPSPIALDMLDATLWASAAAILGTIMAPIFGKISDALKSRKWVLLIALLGGVGYTSLVFTSSNIHWYYGIVILGGIAGGGVPSVIWAATPETVRSELIPSANAFVAFTQNFGMFIGAIAMGSATLSFGWVKASFALLVPCYVICVFILLLGLRKLK
jgi:MFS family permease